MLFSALFSSIRILPLTLATAALAFGVHAGEVVQQARAKQTRPVVRSLPTKSVQAVEHTRIEIELAQEILARKEEADDSKRQYDLRARLLETSEKRLDAKLAQIKAAGVLSGQSPTSAGNNGNTQFASLVKVYEVMKPKDAARIFEKLDLPVQLAVATAMKERNMAALMSEMSPEAARKLTMEMAMQAQLTGFASRQGRSYVAR
jgi:flagellar motility protein MotE (MotC chaperone)